MKIRAAKLLAAIFASILSSANVLAAPGANVPAAADATEAAAADRCLTSPRDYAPPGTRWRYRLERSTGRQCWFLKDDGEKAAGKAAEQSAAATEKPVPAPTRRKSATPRSLSDARAEFSQQPVDQGTRPAPGEPAPAASAQPVENSPPSAAKSANMLTPAAATRWPEPMSSINPAANPPASPAEPSAETRSAPPATMPPAKPQIIPRAVPPAPASEKPMSLPMLITVVAGGLSVLAVLVSMLLAWLASRKARLTLTAPEPPLELPDTPRRPGDLYRARQRLRAHNSGRRAA